MTTLLASLTDRNEQGGSETKNTAPLYRQGLEHLQAGEWGGAIQCFSELARHHPQDETYARLLREAQLKGKLGERIPRRHTGRTALNSRRVWVFLLLNLAVWLVVFGRQLYFEQIVPSLHERQAMLEQQQLLGTGKQFLITGNLDEAEARVRGAIARGPESAAARATLQEINRRRELIAAYDTAVALVAQEDWDAALEALETVRRDDPSFRDVQEQISHVKDMQARAAALETAKTLAEAGDWQLATEQLLLLRDEEPDFKPDVVKRLLVEVYVKQADAALANVMYGATRDIDQLQSAIGSLTELVRGTTQEIEQLKMAIQFLARALEVDPGDQNAIVQTDLAQEYLAGLEAYRRGSWESAAIHLANIYPVSPGYGNGRAALLLQASFVQNGIRYLDAEEPERAAERYRQAIALGMAGDGRPVPVDAQRLLSTADSLSRERRIQEAVVVYAQILIKMGFEEVEGVVLEFSGATADEDVVRQRPPVAPAGAPLPEAPPAETPLTEVAAPPPTETASAEPVATPPPAELYVVRPRDTLSGIALRFGTTVVAILQANEFIENPNLIRPGWRLLIPPQS